VCGICQPPSRAGKSAKTEPRVTRDETVGECSTVQPEAVDALNPTLAGYVDVEQARHEASCRQAA
jgi:flagellar transcriptional activator FlhC